MISLQFLFSDTTHRLQKILKAEFLQPEHVILLADEEAVQRRGDRAEHRALAAEEAQDEVERAQLLVLGLPRADGHAHRSRHLLRLLRPELRLGVGPSLVTLDGGSCLLVTNQTNVTPCCFTA